MVSKRKEKSSKRYTRYYVDRLLKMQEMRLMGVKSEQIAYLQEELARLRNVISTYSEALATVQISNSYFEKYQKLYSQFNIQFEARANLLMNKLNDMDAVAQNCRSAVYELRDKMEEKIS